MERDAIDLGSVKEWRNSESKMTYMHEMNGKNNKNR